MRCQVSPDETSLQQLHDQTGWTPGAEHIRPDAASRAQKELLFSNLDTMWASPGDWVRTAARQRQSPALALDAPPPAAQVMHQVFSSPTQRRADGRRCVIEAPPPGRFALRPQPFPYLLPVGTQHLVLWSSSPRAATSADAITAAIADALDAEHGGGRSGGGGDFVWYENPKKSVVDARLHHVQVFWRPPPQQPPPQQQQPPPPPSPQQQQPPPPPPPQGLWLPQYARSQESPPCAAAKSLVEMGFALADAREALYRSGNDIAAAAGLLADRAATIHSAI